MRDLRSPRLIWAKAILFLVIGFISSGLILFEVPNLLVLMLLALTVWAFCRAYYFAFYALERYVDPSYRFSGLISLARYVWTKTKNGPP
ncbi:MAG TPA: hypothetical protein VL981_06405 [Candidatus Methylacidiphilales bacterium]|nr:hypothetical protein [Candidatus Methylacidiphilales bacterium]